MRPTTSLRALPGIVPALAFALALAGCGSKPPTSPTSGAAAEQTSITTTLAADPSFLADGLIDASTQTAAYGARPAGSLAAITPLTFWRAITRSDLAFTFVFADSDSAGRPRQADVTVTRHFFGTFNIVKAIPGDPPVADTAHVIHKPLADTWVRHLRLRRLPSDDAGHTAWRLVAGSLVEVTSRNAASQIASLRVQGTECDTTITDPSALWALPRIRQFAAGDSVTFTATTSNADDIVLAFWHDHRERFHNNGDGTHTFVLHIGGDDGGWRWFAVNALSNGTLFDDALPYDSKAWVFGCFVGPRPAREYF
jgi:hypothetical protein